MDGNWFGVTLTDKVGAALTLIIFALMAWAYWYVFRPGSDKLERGKYLVFDDERAAQSESGEPAGDDDRAE